MRLVVADVSSWLGSGAPFNDKTQNNASLPLPIFAIHCAASAQRAAFARQPGAALAYRAFLQQVAQLPPAALARLLAAPDVTVPDVTVPVVMHIIHTGGSDNISHVQVNDALRVINEDFSKTNRDTADVIPAFQSIYANPGFKMKLAHLDPTGKLHDRHHPHVPDWYQHR